MNWRPFISLVSFILLALILGLAGWFTQSEMMKWATLAVALAFVSVGLGVNSLIITLHIGREATRMETKLARIEGLQEEMQKEQTEQKEQKSSGPSIIASLQAMSQTYMDYINKQKEEDKK